jgi:hypothetical protein
MNTNCEPLLNTQDVRKILRCSMSLVYRMAEDGRLPCVKIPCPGKGKQKHLIRFKKEDVINFIEKNYLKRGDD